MTAVSFTVTKIVPLEPSAVIAGIAGEAMTPGVVCQKNTSEVWVKADASTQEGCTGLLGLVIAGGKRHSAGTIASGEKISLVVFGRVAGFASLSEAVDYYLSDTAGVIADAKGTCFRFLGHAEGEEVFFFNPVGVPTSA